MKKNFKLYISLFLATLKISAFTFGGGFVIISLMRKEFVQKRKWLTDQEMLNFTALAQSSPGAVAINTCLLVGHHIGGFLGAALTVLAAALPPLTIISIISLFYTVIRDNMIVSYILMGMQAGVAAVLCDVIMGLSASVWRESRTFALVVMILSFLALALLSINVIFVIAACAVAGVIYFGKTNKKGLKNDLS
ncbi:MAG: chromate transporter [Clostridiales bacterium]|nr:chromate transporter [Clostridiales bacterium]